MVTGKRCITDICTRQTLGRLALKTDFYNTRNASFGNGMTTGGLEYQVILPSKLRVCTLKPAPNLVQWADLDFVAPKPTTPVKNEKDSYIDGRGGGGSDGQSAKATSVLELGQKRGKAKIVCGVNCRGRCKGGRFVMHLIDFFFPPVLQSLTVFWILLSTYLPVRPW